jgi:hypothetical protein
VKSGPPIPPIVELVSNEQSLTVALEPDEINRAPPSPSPLPNPVSREEPIISGPPPTALFCARTDFSSKITELLA